MKWGDLFRYIRESAFDDPNFLEEKVYIYIEEDASFETVDLLVTGADDIMIGADRTFLTVPESNEE